MLVTENPLCLALKIKPWKPCTKSKSKIGAFLNCTWAFIVWSLEFVIFGKFVKVILTGVWNDGLEAWLSPAENTLKPCLSEWLDNAFPATWNGNDPNLNRGCLWSHFRSLSWYTKVFKSVHSYQTVRGYFPAPKTLVWELWYPFIGLSIWQALSNDLYLC